MRQGYSFEARHAYYPTRPYPPPTHPLVPSNMRDLLNCFPMEVDALLSAEHSLLWSVALAAPVSYHSTLFDITGREAPSDPSPLTHFLMILGPLIGQVAPFRYSRTTISLSPPLSCPLKSSTKKSTGCLLDRTKI